MKRKTIKKRGYTCHGCWSDCRKRGGDRDDESSGKNVLFSVNTEQRPSKETMKSLEGSLHRPRNLAEMETTVAA